MAKFSDGDTRFAGEYVATNPLWSWRPDGSMAGDVQLYAWLYEKPTGTLFSRKVFSKAEPDGTIKMTVELILG